MVIAKSFKDSELSIFILFIFLVIVLTIGIVAATYIPILLLKILIICITSILLLLTFYIPYFVYKQRKQQEDVILYDNIKEKFVINYHNKTVIINKNEIIRITNHNLCIDKTSLFLARQNYGKIKFFLNNGKSYMTPYIDNIYDVYLKTDEIIYGLTNDENYNEEIRPKDSFIEFQTKFGNWGAKKEYPTILSFIIAIILPIIGLIFVENQAKYKEIKYGKNNGLIILSLTISLLWWIIFIFIISFL